MSKLIPMEEAAKVLGLSVEKLNELRSNNEVFGYRDGSTWKFKMSELERVADDMGLSISPLSSAVDGIKDVLGLGDDETDSSELDLGLDESSQDLFLESDSDSIAMDDSSVELFQSPIGKGDGGTSSDILSGDDDDDDDLSLFDSSDDLNLDEALDDAADELMLEDSSDDLKLEDSSDDLKLEDSSDDLKLEDSGLQLKADGEDSVKLSDDSVLDGDDDLSFGSSSLELASEVKSSDSPSSTGDDLFSEESTGWRWQR
jgi:excisionase family DNA binding protein